MALVSLNLLLNSNSAGRAAGANQGNTGAPGDNSRTCISCHNSGNIEVELNMVLLNDQGKEVSQYIPNQKYIVRVSMDSTGGPAAQGFGFQMVCLDAELDVDGEDLENWVDSGSSNNYKIASARGRQYVEHAGISGVNTFEVEWTAPEKGTGPVSFYASGNGVNFNGGTSGDGAAANKMEITEDINSSTQNVWGGQLNISPNPAIDQTVIQWSSDFVGQISLHTITGQQIQSRKTSSGNGTWILDVKNLQSGLYLMKFMHQDGSAKTMRFIKK